MKELWQKFLRIYGKEHKEKYEDFCKEAFSSYFPDKKIFLYNELKNLNNQDLNKLFVIIVPKFFIDGLNTGRKGQLRTAYNNILKQLDKNQLKKLYAIVYCSPNILDDENMKWWLNWKTKKVSENGINIMYFDGNALIDLAKKYRLFEKYFTPSKKSENKKQETGEKTTLTPEISFHFIDDEEPETENLKKQPSEQAKASAEKQTVENKEQQTTKKQQTQVPPKDIPPQNQQNIKDKTQDEKKQQHTEKITMKNIEEELKKEHLSYNELKKIYSDLQKIINTLTSEQKKEYNKLRKNSKYNYKLFSAEPEKEKKENYKLDNVPTSEKQLKETELILDLFRHIKSAFSKNRFDDTYMFLEILDDFQNYPNILKNKKDEIKKLKEESLKRLRAVLFLIIGDWYLAKFKAFDPKAENNNTQKQDENTLKKNKKELWEKSLLAYEKAYNLFPEDKEITEKFCNLKGDYFLEKNKFAEAEECFEKAYKSFFNPDIKKKFEHAQLLTDAEKDKNKFKFFKKLSLYIKANEKYETLYATEKITNLLIWKIIMLSVALLFVYFFYYSVFAPVKPVESALKKAKTSDEKKYYYWLNLGKKYLNLAEQYPHAIDSAIAFFDSAAKHIQTSVIKNYQQLARNKKERFLQIYEKRLNESFSSFIIEMRKISEGYQFVKFLDVPYDATTGRYGYIFYKFIKLPNGFVYTKKEIKIPPYFSYNPKTMQGNVPNFKKGKAIVLLELTTGKKKYFVIDKEGHLLKEIKPPFDKK